MILALDWLRMILAGTWIGIVSILVVTINTRLGESRLRTSVLRIALVLVLSLQVFVVVIARTRIILW